MPGWVFGPKTYYIGVFNNSDFPIDYHLFNADVKSAPLGEPEPPPEAETVAPPPEEIEAHIRFLSDDLLEGRAVGSRGLAVAALYHENYFRSLGLEPAFGQSFRQPFTLIGSQPDDKASLEIFSEKTSIPWKWSGC